MCRKNKMAVGILAGLLVIAAGAVHVALGQGTSLSIALDAAVVCPDGNVTVSYTVTSTAADAATGFYTVDGGTPVALPSIAAGNVTEGGGWTFSVPGPTKTATGSFTLEGLQNGEYDIQVCFEQQGAEKKSDCTLIVVQVDCGGLEVCDQGAILFGQVVGNKNLCQSEARINVQVKGLFGPYATLGVWKDGALIDTKTTDRAGDSCVYHWNLDPKTWRSAEAGSYLFKVLGQNGQEFEFSADLACSKPGKK